jgi:hypothetical protein
MRWLALSVLLFAGCNVWDDEYDPWYDIPPIDATTPVEVVQVVAARIQYVPDAIHDRDEYWQSPDQTWTWCCGDCEDYVILSLYLLRRQFGGWPELAGGEYDGASHAWVEYDGRWYEPQSGQDVTGDPAYTLLLTISYGEVMERAETRHWSVR